MSFKNLYTIRPGKPEDENFIYATFLRGLYHGNSWFNKIPKDIFFSKYKQVVTALLHSPNTQILVACLPDDIDAILGFSICSKDGQTIHWVHVKGSNNDPEKSWRRNGIGRSLCPVNPKQVTHLTKIGLELLPKLEGCVFDPFL